MPLKTVILHISLAAVCSMGLTGCAALVAGGAAGAGTLAYIQGELKAQIQASPAGTRDAIADAAERLELEQLEARADNLSGRYLFRTGKSEKVAVSYERRDERLTEVSIRVGMFGDEDLSRVLLDEIKKGL